MSTKWIFASVSAFAIGASLAGCPGELDDEARFRVDGGGGGNQDCDALPILKNSCLGAGCHNATDKSANLDLETASVVGRLKGMKTQGAGGSHLLVDPSDPSKSAIYTKTKAPPPFGLVMSVGDKLTAAQQQCIVSWITKELENDPGPTDSGTTEEETGAETGGETGGSDAGPG